MRSNEGAGDPGKLKSVPAEVLADLRKRHAGPQRAYHNWRHIEALLSLFDEVEPLLHSPEAVLYAVLFHDVIYEPTRGDNEERSAELLCASASRVLDPAALARAAGLVLATKKHTIPEGLDEGERSDLAHFLDMDLSILGADDERFDEYERWIRIEYAHVPDEAFRSGRRKVLETFQEREHLFFTPWGRDRFEARARQNIVRSLARLADPRRSL